MHLSRGIAFLPSPPRTRVPDEVGKNLPEVRCKRIQWCLIFKLCLDQNACVQNAALEELKNTIQDLRQTSLLRLCRLAVKPQGLHRDVGHPCLLFLRLHGVIAQLRILRGAQQVKQVRNRFERSINLMRDGAGKATNHRELFRFA